MNRPSSTITAATIGGVVAGLLILALSMADPELYARLRAYPGAEAHLATAAALVAGYFKKENVLPLAK